MKKRKQTEKPLLSKRMWLLFTVMITTFSLMASGNEFVLADGIQKTQQSGVTITGVVTDNVEPIIGASVLVKDNQTGTITDFDGNFTLSNVPPGAILQVSYIGYLTQEVKLGNERHLHIVLKEDSQTLDEVVVVGYGTQKKVNLTGAVGQVDSKIIESRPVMNASSALQGTIPNLQILPESGDPSASTTLNVRGTTSINGGGPLVLVDGVEMSLDMVNPNDIANVTVLKDAAAAAIYGVRAAFGVVLVTTKTAGTDSKTTVSYSGSIAFSQATNLPEMVGTSWEHAEFIDKAVNNAGVSEWHFDPRIVDRMKAYDKDPKNNPEYDIVNGKFEFYGYTNWVKRMLKKFTPSQRHNVNISGGNEKTRFYSSIGYLNQEGIYKYGDDNFKRLNTRLNVDNYTTPWLKLGAKVLYNYSSSSKPYKYKDNNEIFSSMVFSAPTNMADPYPGVAGYPEYDDYIGTYFDEQNAIAYLDKGGRDQTMTHDVWLTASADLTFTKNWKARVDFTYNLNYQNMSEYKKPIDMITATFDPTRGTTNGDYYQRENRNKDYYSFNAFTEYENTFKGKHYVKGMIGYNQELTKYNEFWGRRTDMLSPEIPSLSLSVGQQHQVKETGYEWALRGAFFRLNYIYDSRYLIEVNGRYDGTSRFPSDNRFVFLPSVSAAWRVSEEAFMAPTRDWLDNLKLRASYGVLGNQLLTDKSWTENRKYYPYLPLMASNMANYWLFSADSKSPYINPAYLVTENLTWEKAATINAGIDLTFLDQRLDMSFDWYQRTTSNMLMMKKYPNVLGATAPPTNGAELRTRGWELLIKWNDRIGKDFRYDITLMLSDAQATITKYENESGNIDDYYVGKKYGDIWGYTTDRLFSKDDFDIVDDKYVLKEGVAGQGKIGTNWAPGDVKYKNLDDDNEITPGSRTLDDHGDLKVIGNTTPRYQYGITLNMSYKDIWMNVFFQGIGKRDFFPDEQEWWPSPTQYYNTQKWFARDSWSEDNQNAYFYRPLISSTKNRQKQTRYLQDASYLRMKNLTVGYNIPRTFLNKIGISQASVYVSGENLFTHTGMKGALDPEAVEKKGKMVYPFQKTYSLGLNVTF